jgi:hypothetical protein
MPVMATDLPSMPSAPAPLVDFLRRFRTWSADQINDRISKTEAAPFVLLTPSDQKTPTKVFKLTVDSSGALHVEPMPLGGGKP